MTKAGDKSDNIPLVSVVVSAYQAEQNIAPCLDAILGQTIAEQLEVIVIDSGSPQNEDKIVNCYLSRFDNISYRKTEREHLYRSWNRGIELARGRYVVNANCDDTPRKTAYESLAEALENEPDVDLAYADCAWTGRPNDSFDGPNTLRLVKYPDYHPALTLFFCLTGCVQFWRRSSLLSLGGFDPNSVAAGDYEILFRLVQNRGKAIHVRKVLSLYYQNTDGLTLGSDVSAEEENKHRNYYRDRIDIGCLYDVSNENASTIANAWISLGNLAMGYRVPWLDEISTDAPFALDCYRKAVNAIPDHELALNNLVYLLELCGKGKECEMYLERLPQHRVAQIRRHFKAHKLNIESEAE